MRRNTVSNKNLSCTVLPWRWVRDDEDVSGNHFSLIRHIPEHFNGNAQHHRCGKHKFRCGKRLNVGEGGRDGSVGIATRYGLDGPRIESRWGAIFSAPVQTGPGAHPASCTVGTGSFPGVKRPGCGADHPSPFKCRGYERVGLYLYSPSGP